MVKTFPRNRKKLFLSLCAFSVFVTYSLFSVISVDSFSSVPPVIMPFVVLFFTAYFGALLWFFLVGLTAFQTIELNRDEIRLRLGPLVLKRIPTDTIKTVGVCALYSKNSRTVPDMRCLVLSDKSPEELNEKGQKRLKNKKLRNLMQNEGVAAEGAYAAAKVYLFEHLFFAPLWIEQSDEAQQALREVLLCARFLV